MLFSTILADLDNRLCNNLKTTKGVFPEETRVIEHGLDLMYKISSISQEACKEYLDNPNFYANHNLFARNRQLLLQAYLSCLSASYGTEFVILRTVLENNNLMRLFNKEPQKAYDWLPEELQKRFSPNTQAKYGSSGMHDETYDPYPVVGSIFNSQDQRIVKKDVSKLYGQLCNYSHPNFAGWQELISQQGEVELIQKLPVFSPFNAETSVGLMLFTMQLTFKSYVETFKNRLFAYSTELFTWQNDNKKLLTKLTPQ